MTQHKRVNKQSGHARKRWKVTIKLANVTHQHTQKPIELDTYEFTFEILGHDMGVALNRGYKAMRALPELKGAITRDCFVSVRCLGYYTKAMEAIDKGETYPPLEEMAGEDQ